MDDATKSAEFIRKDIKDLRNKSGFVQPIQRCGICDHFTLSREFYFFPCQHTFHADCLIDQMFLHMDTIQQNRVRELLQQIKQLATSESSIKKSITSNNDDKELNISLSKIDKLKVTNKIGIYINLLGRIG